MAFATKMKRSFGALGWPAIFLIALSALVAAQYFGVIDLRRVSLGDFWPKSPEFDKFARDLPSIALAFLFGAGGAFVKISLGAGGDRMRRLIAGGLVGVIVFFLLKSQVVPQIMYDNLPSKRLEVSYYGLALLAVFGGMYASELANWAARRG